MKNRVLKAIMLMLVLTMCFGATVMAAEDTKNPIYSSEVDGDDEDDNDSSDTDKDKDEDKDTNKGSQTSPQTSAGVATYVALLGLSSATVVCGLHKKED